MIIKLAPRKGNTIHIPVGSVMKCDGCGKVWTLTKPKYPSDKHYHNKACYMKNAKRKPLRLRTKSLDYSDPSVLEDIEI